MKRDHQKFVRVFIFIFLGMFALAGCGKGCGTKQGVADQDTLSLIPGDSNVVVGVNWKKLTTSPLSDQLTKKIPEEAKPFLEGTDGLVLGMKYQKGGQDAQEFVAIVKGNLDATALLAKMSEQAKKDNAVVSEEVYQDIKLYSIPKDPKLAVAFLDGLAAFGSKPTLQKMIDLSKKQGESIEKNDQVMNLLKGIDREKMIWAVGVVPEGAIPADNSGAANSPMGVLSGLKAIDLSVDYVDQLVVDLGVMTSSAAEAEQLKNMATSYKTLFGHSLTQSNPDLGKVLDAMTIGSKDLRVSLNLTLDQKTVEALASKAGPEQAPPAAVDPMPSQDAQ